uniref:Uncharacterized protein n=1 Tax=Ochrobactrum phage ORM_20 TaxID=2985243 RepID=A0A9N6ZG37_9VIRU|nr:hypothetical protein ORM20_00200 [Ochrobactrum phage ORM_20]
MKTETETAQIKYEIWKILAKENEMDNAIDCSFYLEEFISERGLRRMEAPAWIDPASGKRFLAKAYTVRDDEHAKELIDKVIEKENGNVLFHSYVVFKTFDPLTSKPCDLLKLRLGTID